MYWNDFLYFMGKNLLQITYTFIRYPIIYTFFQMYSRQWTITYKDHKENKAILQVNSCLVTAHPIDSKISSNMKSD